MPAYNATQSFITAFNSFYSIRFMAGWYKEYNFIEELTDDTCINYHEFEEFLTRWTGYFGEEFQKNYFAYKKQTLNLARANVEFEH